MLHRHLFWTQTGVWLALIQGQAYSTTGRFVSRQIFHQLSFS